MSSEWPLAHKIGTAGYINQPSCEGFCNAGMFRGLQFDEGGWLSSTARQRATLPAEGVGGEFTALSASLSKTLHFLFFHVKHFISSLPLLQTVFINSAPSCIGTVAIKKQIANESSLSFNMQFY